MRPIMKIVVVILTSAPFTAIAQDQAFDPDTFTTPTFSERETAAAQQAYSTWEQQQYDRAQTDAYRERSFETLDQMQSTIDAQQAQLGSLYNEIESLRQELDTTRAAQQVAQQAASAAAQQRAAQQRQQAAAQRQTAPTELSPTDAAYAEPTVDGYEDEAPALTPVPTPVPTP